MKIDRQPVRPGKLSDIRGEKPDFPCILCAIRDREPKVTNFEITRNKQMIVSLNLYPYNPGHVMIFPMRHLTDIRDLTDEEIMQMHRLQGKVMAVLESVYGPSGFNIGYNLGETSEASIEHIHCHVVPRHRNEIGLLEMISQGVRVLVEDPLDTLEKLRKAFAELENEKNNHTFNPT